MTAALIVTIVVAAGLLVALVVEETARREWRREAGSAHKRVCHHGGTTFQPFDGDDAVRHQVGRRP